LADGKVGIGKGKAENSSHEIGGGVGDLDGRRLVAAFDQSEDLFNLLRILSPFFRHNEQGAFERNNGSNDGSKEERPHNGATVNEGTDDRIFIPVISEGLSHGEVRGDDRFSSSHEGGKGRTKDFRVLCTFEDRFF
jgi:hypothetical protein